MMEKSRDSIIVYCEIHRGYGHWMRFSLIAKALARRFHVVMVVTGDRPALDVPEGVELITFPRNAHFPCSSPDGVKVPLGGHLAAILERVQPRAVILEYFPFGRQQSAVFLIPFIRAARECASRPLVLSSIRDIQEQSSRDQFRNDKRVVQTVNRWFDGVMVHADPRLFAFEESFALPGELTVPLWYTGYVAPEPMASMPEPQPGRRIVVSAGGGYGGESLLRMAIQAQALAKSGTGPGAHAWDFQMLVIAGKFLDEQEWQRLQTEASGVPDLELLRWVPDLRRELASAAVSISRCGYNTTLNILAVGTRSLVVPYGEEEEDEQAFRAAKLEGLGVLRSVPESQLTPASLISEIRATASMTPTRLDIDCGGAANTLRLVEDLISAPAATPADSKRWSAHSD